MCYTRIQLNEYTKGKKGNNESRGRLDTLSEEVVFY